MIVHEPAAVAVTVVPDTVQLPLALKLTKSPDEAVALTPNVESPYVLFASAPNVMV